MRVAGVFPRLLGLFAARVVAVDVECGRGEDVVVVDVARRRNRRMLALRIRVGIVGSDARRGGPG